MSESGQPSAECEMHWIINNCISANKRKRRQLQPKAPITSLFMFIYSKLWVLSGRCMNICISGISQERLCCCVCAVAATDCASAARFLGSWRETASTSALRKELWVESQKRSELWWPVCWNEKERGGCVVVPFGVIKTKSSARERRNEKYSRIYAKRKAKGKSFCWLNYINMTNDFFGERDRARWPERHTASCKVTRSIVWSTRTDFSDKWRCCSRPRLLGKAVIRSLLCEEIAFPGRELIFHVCEAFAVRSTLYCVNLASSLIDEREV